MPKRPLAGVPQVAEYLDLPVKTVRDQAHRRVEIGKYAFRVGRYLRWDWDDIDRFVEAQKAAKRT